MSDRELLEMAAKAAGLGEVWYLDGSDTPYVGKKYQLGQPVEYSTFSPLTDDGDALRLAVKLRINIEHVSFMHGEKSEISCYPKGRGDCMACERVSDDPQVICLPDEAATRRAIVRAAAEIGKAMP